MRRRNSRRTAACILGLIVALVVPVALATSAGAASTKAGSCVGFKNRVGMTNSTIRIGNASDVSGPVPGQFTAAQQATKAYVAYFNSRHSLCGHKLALDTYDSKTDATADKQAYTKICSKDFAAVGSMSAFDGGGASTARGCDLPDLRAASTSKARVTCSSCFGVNATGVGEWLNSVPDYLTAHHGTATAKAAMLYINIGQAPQQAQVEQQVAVDRGFTYVYVSPVDVAAFNYGPYVQQMSSAGVRLVQFIGAPPQAARLAKAMANAHFHPDVFLVDPPSYSPDLIALGGAAVAGAITYLNFLPLGTNQTELNLYRTWLHRVAPSASPTPAGLFAWSAAKLFTQQAVSLGAKLSRAHLVARLKTIKGWTGGGMHAPMAVGAKHLSPCARFMTVNNGAWVPLGGTSYLCAGITKVS